MILKTTHFQGNKHKRDLNISNGLGFNNKMGNIIQKNELAIIKCYTYLWSLLIIFSDVCIFIQTIHFRWSLCWKVLDKTYDTFSIILFWYKVFLIWWKWISNREELSSITWQFSESIIPKMALYSNVWNCQTVQKEFSMHFPYPSSYSPLNFTSLFKVMAPFYLTSYYYITSCIKNISQLKSTNKRYGVKNQFHYLCKQFLNNLSAYTDLILLSLISFL